MSGLLVMPSRGRPRQLARFINACRDTGVAMKGVLRLDQDDPDLGENLKIEIPLVWERIVGAPVKGADAQNEIFRLHPKAETYGIVADDLIPRTKGWDRALTAAAGRSAIAYGDDLLKSDKLATHPFVGGDLARAAGWLALPGLVHLYVDTVWTEIGRALGILKYLPGVVVEHAHWSVGKAERDQIYRRVDHDGAGYAASDKAVFESWDRTEIAKIRKLLERK